MRELLTDLDRWRRQDKRIAIARVVDVDGSGPRAPGATMAVNSDAEVTGSVSGGCIEGAVVEVALAAIESGDRAVHTFGYSDADAFAVGLTCGAAIRAERPVALATARPAATRSRSSSSPSFHRRPW